MSHDVTVIVPCHNMERFVADAVRSALEQDPPPREVLVVDDASTDRGMETLAGFGDRVRILTGVGEGPAAARNLGILASSADYVAFLDADDRWFPGKLQAQLKRMRDPRVGLVYTDYVRGESLETASAPRLADYSLAGEGWVFSRLLRQNFILTSSVLVRRSLLARSGLFNPHLFGCEDIELWLRVARRAEFVRADGVFAFKRDHAGNITRGAGFPFDLVRRWRVLLAVHGDADPADRRYMRAQLADAEYEAGRHALRLLDPAAARLHLGRAARSGVRGWRAIPWWCLARLPRPALAAVRSTLGADPSPAEVARPD
jgi:glycosyltransferase involved in cell wall biosynthesis